MSFQAVAIWLLVAGVIGTGVGIWSLYQSNIETYRYEKQRASADRQQASRDTANKCGVSFAPVNFIRECLFSEIDAYQKQQNTDQDLKAQQDMAFWGLWMFIATVCGLLASLGGLVMLFISLRHTRIAIRDTREIGEKQVRAYISIEAPFGEGTIGGGKPMSASMRMINSGQSPAHDVKYIAAFFIDTNDFGGQNYDFGVPIKDPKKGASVVPVNGFQFMEAIEHTPFTPEEIDSTMRTGEKTIYLGAIILYKDVFGHNRKTRFCAAMTNSGQVMASKDGRVGRKFDWVLTSGHNDAT